VLSNAGNHLHIAELDAARRAGFDRCLDGRRMLSVVVNSLCGVTVVTHFSDTEIIR